MLNILLPYFEMITVYRGERTKHPTEDFLKGVKTVFEDKIVKGNDERINFFYGQCRCGLFHELMIRSEIQIKHDLDEPFDFSKKPIKVNPHKLLSRIAEHFGEYILDMKNNPTGALSGEFEKAFLKK